MMHQFKRFSFLLLFICFLASAAAQTTGNIVTPPTTEESESTLSETEQTAADGQSQSGALDNDDNSDTHQQSQSDKTTDIGTPLEKSDDTASLTYKNTP